MRTNRALKVVLAVALVFAALAGAGTAAYADPRPSTYELPGNAVYPEGIAFEESTGYFYVSSTTDGTIFRGHVKDAMAQVFLPGGQDGRTFVAGVGVDKDGRLFLAGGATGKMFVYDTETKALLGSFTTTRTPTFVNDVAIGKNGDAFFTDSRSPVLYRVYTNSAGELAFEEWLDFTGTALQYVDGFNLNGIEFTPDGKYLLVVQSNTGKVFRITLAAKEVVEIDTGGYAVTGGDGLLVKGHRLYVVVRNSRLVGIAELQLSGDFTSARLVSETTDPSFAFPTTMDDARGRLLVVNSQFNNRGPGLTPDLPFTVSSVKIP